MTTDFAAALRPGPDAVDFTLSMRDRAAVVTGGASGIGLAIAKAFASRGARVAILDLKADAADEAAAALGGERDDHLGLACDVTDDASVTEAMDAVAREAGQLHVLVNCAGIVALDPAEDLSAADWSRTIEVNLGGTFRACQAAGRHMLAAGYGRIVNMSSQAAHVGLDGHAAYCASKAGVTGLTRVFALEWAGRGVTANTISPTVVLTDLGRAAWANEKGVRHQDEIPAGRFAAPDEIAAAAVYLASDAAAMVNGADLRVDGGFTIR